MEYAELENLVRKMMALQCTCVAKQKDFKKRELFDLMEQSQGEALGIGKCISLLGEIYPEEIKTITHCEEVS
ncbi:MAG: hypothetical protein COB84_01945 [Rhodobacteraceae bacterium]|nr:MAG: hypothetical protein COB84_01945 [Paracoccaceae bacterium]